MTQQIMSAIENTRLEYQWLD